MAGQNEAFLTVEPQRQPHNQLYRARPTAVELGPAAKVSVRPGAYSEYALCLYGEDDSRASELQARYPDVKFRGFKTDAASRAGIYSPEFLAPRNAA